MLIPCPAYHCGQLSYQHFNLNYYENTINYQLRNRVYPIHHIMLHTQRSSYMVDRRSGSRISYLGLCVPIPLQQP